MRVMVIGSGGREHVLAGKLAQSPRVEQILCVPGNAGTATLGENVPADLADLDALVQLAKDREVDLTIVGPEAPLCAGLVDRFEAAGLRVFGPSAAAARLEGDKAYAKQLMRQASVPTAEGRAFHNYLDAKTYVATRDTGLVVKAAGLAAGKGVFVCDEPSEALLVLENIMVDRIFGDAGSTVIVEERLVGPEISVLALVDGQTIYTLEAAQDHKAVGEGDVGANTGGMGAYCPAPIATDNVLEIVERDVLVPIVDMLRSQGVTYRGVLYAGLMLTPAGPKVLEFNCRFGDPEVQALLMRLESDLLDAIEAVVDGRLADLQLKWNPQPAVCVVMASAGYPGKYAKGKVIDGLDDVAQMPDVTVFHAGTATLGGRTVTSGGRVLGVTALGSDLAAAQQRAYQAAERITFEGAFYRRDIADKALKGEKVSGRIIP